MMKVEVVSEWNGEDVKFKGRNMTNKSIFEIGLAVQTQAKALCPVKRGRLRGSYTTQSRTQGTDVQAVPESKASDKIRPPGADIEVLVGTGVEYGPYVEFGTVRSNAQPHLRPALDAVTGKVAPITQKNAKRELGDYLK